MTMEVRTSENYVHAEQCMLAHSSCKHITATTSTYMTDITPLNHEFTSQVLQETQILIFKLL